MDGLPMALAVSSPGVETGSLLFGKRNVPCRTYSQKIPILIMGWFVSSPVKSEVISPAFSYNAPEIVQREANIKDYPAEYVRSIKDPEAF